MDVHLWFPVPRTMEKSSGKWQVATSKRKEFIHLGDNFSWNSEKQKKLNHPPPILNITSK